MTQKRLAQQPIDLEYELVFSKRKTIGVYVYPGSKVVVRAPNRVPRREIEAFVLDRLDWIASKQEQMSKIPRAPEISFQDRDIHYYLGGTYELRITRHTRNSVYKVKDSLVVALKEPWNETTVKKQLTRWYREQAMAVFEQRLRLLFAVFAEHGVHYPILKVRKMKSRWGSCSTAGEITLSLELVRFPLPMIDYVIIHELCHLIEFNHSPRFYELMTAALPDWRRLKKELEALSRKLGSIH